MYQVEVVYDETNSTLRWLRVSHNGASWSSIQVRSNEEALQIITALQQSVQSDGACAHAHLEAYEFGYYCKDCGMANPPRR